MLLKEWRNRMAWPYSKVRCPPPWPAWREAHSWHMSILSRAGRTDQHGLSGSFLLLLFPVGVNYNFSRHLEGWIQMQAGRGQQDDGRGRWLGEGIGETQKLQAHYDYQVSHTSTSTLIRQLAHSCEKTRITVVHTVRHWLSEGGDG